MNREPRLRINKNPAAGMRNRQIGISKMAHTWFRFYGGEVLLLIRKHDGQWGGYQSRTHLVEELSQLNVPDNSLMGPRHFPSNKVQTSSVDCSVVKTPMASDSPGRDQNNTVILEPRPISGRVARQKEVLISLLESAFDKPDD